MLISLIFFNASDGDFLLEKKKKDLVQVVPACFNPEIFALFMGFYSDRGSSNKLYLLLAEGKGRKRQK